MYLSAGTYGDLVYRDGSGEEIVVYKDYVYDPGESAMFRTALEGAVCFDKNLVFLIKADANRAPDEDMGGRLGIYHLYHYDGSSIGWYL